jgi:hypothetical protein
MCIGSLARYSPIDMDMTGINEPIPNPIVRFLLLTPFNVLGCVRVIIVIPTNNKNTKDPVYIMGSITMN